MNKERYCRPTSIFNVCAALMKRLTSQYVHNGTWTKSEPGVTGLGETTTTVSYRSSEHMEAIFAHSEAQLVVRAASGDHEAFAHLIELHERFVYRVVLRLLRDHHTAEDVTQEVLLRAWQALPGLRSEHSLRPWLARVATNAALSRLRRRRLPTVALSECLIDTGETPTEIVVRAKTYASIIAALGALPREQRHALVLRFGKGLSYEQIATATSWPLGTVKSTISRGRRRLCDALGALAPLLLDD